MALLGHATLLAAKAITTSLPRLDSNRFDRDRVFRPAVFEELEDTDRRSAEDEIRRAREVIRSGRTRFVPESSSTRPGLGGKFPANPGEPTPGLEPGTPSLRVMNRCPLQSVPVSSGRLQCALHRTGADWR
jgi:hypothetical protein